MASSEKTFIISEIDMNFVQLLITAVNESRLGIEYKDPLRKELDRWQNALTLASKIVVTF